MFRMTLSAILAASLLVPVAGAETLLVQRVQKEAATPMPVRGMTMAQVQARFGQPSSRLDPRGGQKRAWPTINRWQYPGFVVYFEHDHVIHSVLNTPAGNNTNPAAAN